MSQLILKKNQIISQKSIIYLFVIIFKTILKNNIINFLPLSKKIKIYWK